MPDGPSPRQRPLSREMKKEVRGGCRVGVRGPAAGSGGQGHVKGESNSQRVEATQEVEGSVDNLVAREPLTFSRPALSPTPPPARALLGDPGVLGGGCIHSTAQNLAPAAPQPVQSPQGRIQGASQVYPARPPRPALWSLPPAPDRLLGRSPGSRRTAGWRAARALGLGQE